MIRFNNDYNRGAMPEVMQALNNLQSESFAGYGDDSQCDNAAAIIRRLTGCESVRPDSVRSTSSRSSTPPSASTG